MNEAVGMSQYIECNVIIIIMLTLIARTGKFGGSITSVYVGKIFTTKFAIIGTHSQGQAYISL